jgi:glucose-1-phosphate cytidylyltransferase
MKVVILAGGMGSRLSEETPVRPKPMVEIGPYPILWHIMRHYSHYELNDFVICLGYKGYIIKEYFANYVLHRSDILVDVEKKRIKYLGSQELPPRRVALVDTGPETKTGGRLKRIAGHLPADEPFCMTYGDGVSNVDLTSLITFHKKTGLAARSSVFTTELADYGSDKIPLRRAKLSSGRTRRIRTSCSSPDRRILSLTGAAISSASWTSSSSISIPRIIAPARNASSSVSTNPT